MADGRDLDFAQVIKQAFDVESGGLKINNVSQLVPGDYDTIEMSYTGDDVTEVVYKKNGSTVAVLDLVYSAGKLTSVTRS